MSYVKRMGVNVYVPVGTPEARSLLPEKYRKNKLTYPYVLLTDSTLKADYGFYQQNQLKSQEFSKIFREAKSKIRDAKKNGDLANFQAPKESAVAGSQNSDLTQISSPEFDNWTSAKGSSIRAKLINYRESTGSYEFELQNGKTIKVNGSELTPDSVTKAREVLKKNS